MGDIKLCKEKVDGWMIEVDLIMTEDSDVEGCGWQKRNTKGMYNED